MANLRVRRNIDALSGEEIANYLYALQKLHEISNANPDSIDGYTYFEQLHDGSIGPCEHANDTFLPWHRAHIFLFEEALRRSDPPRTANVTVPYWDWSALPSGERYPKRFEDPGTLLSHNRNTGKICRDGGDSQCERLAFPRDYLEREVLVNPAWSSVQPSTPGSAPAQSFGGYAGGESNCASQFGKGFGVLESPAHNSMHGLFIGGDMADPSAAALDPIFFSFHAYFDLLWWQWQQMTGHTVDTGLESRLCGLFTDRDHRPEKRFKVKDLLDIEKQLQYTYEYTRPQLPVSPPSPGQLFETHPAVDLVLSGKKAPELVRSLEVIVPNAGFSTANLNFTGLKTHTPFSYGADIYLYPRDKEFRPQDRTFRISYLLDFMFVWKAHHHGTHDDPGHMGRADATVLTQNIALNVTDALTTLSKVQPGLQWIISIALTSADMPMADHAAALPLARAPNPRRLDFGRVELRIT